MTRRLTNEEFIEKCRGIHGDRFDYAKVEYLGGRSQIVIGCHLHGEFTQEAASHGTGSVCPACAAESGRKKRTRSAEEFIAESKVVHNDIYDYSLTRYTTALSKVTITCREHGEFSQVANKHLAGQGCPNCGKALSISTRATDFQEFVRLARFVHGDKYTYSPAGYVNLQGKVEVTCRRHGLFYQGGSAHIAGQGCPLCGIEARSDASRLTTEAFITSAASVHGDTYDYSLVDYSNSNQPVEIICRTHGPFFQRPADHTSKGAGCPACSNIGPSAGQLEVYEFLSRHTKATLEHPIGSRRRIDIFLPDHGIGVEYDGLIWHSSKFQKSRSGMLNRDRVVKGLGIRLIHVFEDEWRDKREIVKRLLLSAVGKTEKLNARSLDLSVVDGGLAGDFMDKYHIQGRIRSGFFVEYVGLHLDGVLVACMGFSRSTSVRSAVVSSSTVELRRYASSATVRGGSSRLLAYFLSLNKNYREIISYSENRLYSGNMYRALGFSLVGCTPPDYSYVRSESKPVRHNKSLFQRKHLPKRLGPLFNPLKTEEENCRSAGWFQVFDTGKSKWVLTK